MESMKKMENIKPAYAVKLGAGMFAGEDWQCMKCGAQVRLSGGTPSPSLGGSCPETSTGHHVWQRM